MAALIALLGAGVGRAQPTVRVRAMTRIELSAEQEDSMAHVSGRLLDDLDRPLPARQVQLGVRDALPSPRHASVTTDAAGKFSWDVDVDNGEVRLLAEHSGDALHDPCERAISVDPTRAPVRLALTAQQHARLDLDSPPPIEVWAQSSAGTAGLVIELRNELGRLLARGAADSHGRFVADPNGDTLGPPGFGALVARTGADASHAEGYAQVGVVRFRRTRIDAAVRADADELRVEGVLRDARGGLGHEAVGLFGSGAHLATVWTDASGRYAYRARRRDPARDQAWIEARFDSAAPWIGSSRSGRTWLPPRSAAPDATWLVLSAALTALLLVVTARRKPHASRTERAARTSSAAGVFAPTPPRWKRPLQWQIAGRVLDASGDPVSAARVQITTDGAPGVTLPVDGHGAFASGPLPAGRWTLRIVADGYAPLDGTLHVPHRGDWSNVLARLETLRALAESHYRQAALALLPRPALWPVWSERETLEWRREGGGVSRTLARLVDRVERARYGPIGPTPEDVVAIERDARAVLAEVSALRPEPRSTDVDAPRGPFL